MEAFMREFISHSSYILGAENIWQLEQEFVELRGESGFSELSCDIGKRIDNRRKNRYRDILPFDDSRVVLPLLPNDADSDYINANLVRGATGQHYSYIASQGPLRNTLGDFWRMLFHFNVKTIVMLCNERENDKPKCERYWPTISDKPSMRIDVFETSADSEHLNAFLRSVSRKSSNGGTERQVSNSGSNDGMEDASEQCVALHFELELLHETNEKEYSVRTIRATKVETFIEQTEDTLLEVRDAADKKPQDADESDSLYENVEVRPTVKRTERKETREVVQFHYRNWADYAATDELDSILAMRAEFRRHQPSITVPICVHCSAGCGRTGTILFIDYVATMVNRGFLDRFLLRKSQSTGKGTEYDFERSVREFVRRIVLEFRKQRPAAVQSFEQFAMCYRAASEIFKKQLALVDAHIYVNVAELRASANTDPVSTSKPTHVETVTLSSLVRTDNNSTPATPSSAKDSLTKAIDKLIQQSNNTNLDEISTITCKNSLTGAGDSVSPKVVVVKGALDSPDNSSQPPKNSNYELFQSLSSRLDESKKDQQQTRSRTPDPEGVVVRRSDGNNSVEIDHHGRRMSKDDSFLPNSSTNVKKPAAGLQRHLGEIKHYVRK